MMYMYMYSFLTCGKTMNILVTSHVYMYYNFSPKGWYHGTLVYAETLFYNTADQTSCTTDDLKHS